MNEILIMFLLITGSFFILMSSVGLIRMPDLYLRLTTTSKANTIGVGMVLLGLVLSFKDLSIITRSVTAFLFILLTVPISSHFVGRVAYFIGIEKWKGMKKDDLKHKFGLNWKAKESRDV